MAPRRCAGDAVAAILIAVAVRSLGELVSRLSPGSALVVLGPLGLILATAIVVTVMGS